MRTFVASLLLTSACEFGSSGQAVSSDTTAADDGADDDGVATSSGPPADTGKDDGDAGSDSDDASTSSDGPADATSSDATSSDTTSTTGSGQSCGADNGGCDENATCDDTRGPVQCTCNPGYDGNGQHCDVDATLETLRWDLECLPQAGCAGDWCPAMNYASDSATLQGDPRVVFDVTLWFRGVVEEKQINGGTSNGMWNEGGNPANDGWNVISLEISDPPQLYYLNDGASEVDYTTLLDMEQTIPIRGGATVLVQSQDTNNCITHNHDQADDPIAVPDIRPYPETVEGQFVQVDVVAITPQ